MDAIQRVLQIEVGKNPKLRSNYDIYDSTQHNCLPKAFQISLARSTISPCSIAFGRIRAGDISAARDSERAANMRYIKR